MADPVEQVKQWFTNPNLTAGEPMSSPSTIAYTNDIANSRFNKTSGEHVFRTNAALYPRGNRLDQFIAVSDDDWLGAVSQVITSVDEHPIDFIDSGLRVTANIPMGWMGFETTYYMGNVGKASVWVRSSVATKVRMVHYWVSAANATIGAVFGSSITLPADTWVRVVENVAPLPGGVKFRLSVQTDNTIPVVAGQKMYASGFMGGTTADQSYFDGYAQSEPDEDLITKFAGAADTTIAQLVGKLITGVSAFGCIGIQSKKYAPEGQHSLRLISRTTVPGPAMYASVTLPSTAPGTAIGTVHCEDESLIANSVIESALPIVRSSGFETIGEESHKVRLEYPNLPAVSTIRFYHGGAPGVGAADVYWTDTLVTPGKYAGEYFNGSTESADEDLTNTWSGIIDASRTLALGRPVNDLVYPSMCVAIQSKKYAGPGENSIRLISKAEHGGVPAMIAMEMPFLGDLTILATSHIETVLPPGSDANAGGLISSEGSIFAQRGTEVGTEKLVLSFKDPQPQPDVVYFMHGGPEGSSDVYFTDIGVFDYGYDGEVFHPTPHPGERYVKHKDQWLLPYFTGTPNRSPSQIDYVLPNPPLMTWDDAGDRKFELGIDRGMLYVGTEVGVPWNGLLSVAETLSGGDASAFYLDGVKYLNQVNSEEFAATITAYTYPNEFEACEGSVQDEEGLIPDSGVFIDKQAKVPFDLSYRTTIGNDLDGLEHGYKIHLVYNALAVPQGVTYSTRTQTVSPTNFAWAITTTPEKLDGRKPTAHLTIDSTKAGINFMKEIEKILYGSDNIAPRMIRPNELIQMSREWFNLKITDHGDGTFTAEGHAVKITGPDTFVIDWPSIKMVSEDTYIIDPLIS